MEDNCAILLVGLDLDGTLLNSYFELTPDVIQAFNHTSQVGIKLVVITGRDKRSALPFLKQLGAEQTVITSGGAQIWLNGKKIVTTSFTYAQALDVINIGLGHSAGMFVDQDQRTWRCGSKYYTDLFGKVSESIDKENSDELLDPLPCKISIIQEPSVLGLVRTKLKKVYPEMTLTSPFEQVLDVNPPGVNKGAALSRLAGLFGIPLGQTAVAGDSENDSSMFAIAGLTFAMGNAAAFLRAQATYVAPSNDENGVVWILEKIRGLNLDTGLHGYP